jgi:hypothetical protein
MSFTTVSSLKGILDSLRIIVDGKQQRDTRLSHLTVLVEPLRQCEAALQKLEAKLDIKFGTEAGQITVKFKKSLKWPFQKIDVSKILETIDRHTFSL